MEERRFERQFRPIFGLGTRKVVELLGVALVDSDTLR